MLIRLVAFKKKSSSLLPCMHPSAKNIFKVNSILPKDACMVDACILWQRTFSKSTVFCSVSVCYTEVKKNSPNIVHKLFNYSRHLYIKYFILLKLIINCLHPHPAHTSLARMGANLLHVQEFELPIISQRRLCMSSISRLKTKKILHVPGRDPGPRCEGCG